MYDAQQVDVTDPDGTPTLQSQTSSFSAGASTAKLLFNTGTYSAGTKVTSDKPFFVYYEHNGQDETNVFSSKQARKFVESPASVSLGSEVNY